MRRLAAWLFEQMIVLAWLVVIHLTLALQAIRRWLRRRRRQGFLAGVFLLVFACNEKKPEVPGPRVEIHGPRMVMGMFIGPRRTDYTINVFRCDDCVVGIIAQGYPTNDLGDVISTVPFREYRAEKPAVHTIPYRLPLTHGAWFIKTVLIRGDQIVAENEFRTQVRDEEDNDARRD